MPKLREFNDKAMQAYLKSIQNEEFYEMWNRALVITINGNTQEMWPLVRVKDSRRETPYTVTMTADEYDAYQAKVAHYLNLENSMTKMNVFGTWVRHSHMFKPAELKEILDPEMMLEQPEEYLDKFLPKFPLNIQTDVRNVVDTMQTWKRLMEYL